MAKEDKRDAILQATLELLAEKGFHDSPCALIADRAGVAAGTIYRYFENKDVLINALFKEVEARITSRLLEGYYDGAALRDQFLHMSAALLTYFVENPMDFRFVEQFMNSPYGAAHRRDTIFEQNGEAFICRKIFEAGLKQQLMKDLPLVVLFALTFGPLVAVARDHTLGFVVCDQVLILKTAEACWDSVKR